MYKIKKKCAYITARNQGIYSSYILGIPYQSKIIFWKQEARGPHRSPRETHLCNDYAITLGGKISLSPFSRTEWLIIYKNVSPRITLIYYVSSLVEIGPVVFKKTIFINFVNVNLILHYNPPLKGQSPLFVKVWLILAQWFWRKRFF